MTERARRAIEQTRRAALAAELRRRAQQVAGPTRLRDALATARGGCLALEHGFRLLGLAADVAADTMSTLAERISTETPGGDNDG